MAAEQEEFVPKGQSNTEISTKTEPRVESSPFGRNEGKITFAWLLFTGLYWTILIWIPTIQTLSFGTGGFIAWCLGFIGLVSSSYTLYEGKYPSGATSTDQFETKGIGRYTAALLTICMIVDVCVLIFIALINDDYKIDEDNVMDAIRLTLHCISIFWASLFFYNKFYRFHAHMATVAFFTEWVDIIWSVIVAYTLNELLLDDGEDRTAIHYVYFCFIVIELCGWMVPMMLLPKWVSHCI